MVLRLFFGKKSQRAAPRAPEGCRAYAIGDIHGRLDLLQELVAKIERDNASRPPVKTYLVTLGDLVDRGPDSRGVIEYLIGLQSDFTRVVHLKGNHEEFFLNVLARQDGMVADWLTYGGYECCESYGISKGWTLNVTPEAVAERLASEVPQRHKDFLEDLADSFRFGDYLFVHAGIRPGLDLSEQTSRDLRWIRDGFLDDRTDHGFVVVHGHTIVADPEQHPNRIAIDTGAYRSGVLTAIGLEGAERWFIDARAEVPTAA
ncbi:MAG: metallophosphoesterase family protein [Allosphingosinicella sp.]|uniref:metallophosphoesterase family protein n=1 Tax=Allosphingosinicella sp. TaxID=2823234 RepID=UPI0039360E2A